MEVTSMSQALQLHAQFLKSQTQNHQNLSNLFTFAALSPSGNLNYARLILNSNPSLNSYYYNTIIRAYSHSSNPTHHLQALSLFLFMLQSPTNHHNVPLPDNFTYPFVLKCCARLKLVPQGKQIHGLITKMGFGSDLYIRNALVHMYSEVGELGVAREVFDRMFYRDVVSWTSMIDGFVNHDLPVEAIELFERMLVSGVEVNDAAAISVLRGCADSGALSVGRKVHGILKEKGIYLKGNVCTALIDMYSKCGCLESARKVFDDVVDRDVFVWTAMISALACHGMCKEAIDMFVEMEICNVVPDERTVTVVLSACRNAGLVREGYMFFNDVQKRYGMKPTIQHFGCMVDLLARGGCLKEAEDFINAMPMKPDAVLWRTLIWACKVHADTERAERLMKHLELQGMGKHDSGSYILASNVYASVGKWCDKAEMRELMNKKGLVKPPGSSRIEVDGVVHEFVMGDYNHPEAEKIFVELDQMVDKLRKQGYNPKVSEVMLEMGDEEKAIQLLHHSEKLALAYGLIRTCPGSKIRIVKNLRSCEDCHEFMKLISKVYQRDIIVRDRIRFHHFKNGDCSCKDYW
ncbi:pentatricopeptide repeat-containing protein At4g21065-like [Vicia villosa]|uniref:pentatricopeptide repeat-containing protein At4g21065-like n=1 Tax=Vicia villosa TaxID=3911 RepID=UPI00273C09CC|nr:pentatricopeptide repeat-containing protein At4g21065-like [Vicia villosa]